MPNEQPLVSVIVPVWNAEAYLKDTLDSLLEQTMDRLEIIAVDDGSQDGSAQILDEYAQKYPQIKVIHQKNQGVSAARRNGILQASAPYIGFMDSDDLADPHLYETLYSLIKKEEADIASVGFSMIFRDGRRYDLHGTGEKIIMDSRQALLEYLKGEKLEPALVSKLFRKEIILKASDPKQFPLQIRTNEDLLLNVLAASSIDKMAHLDKCLYFYMIRPNSSTSHPNHQDALRVLDLIEQIVPEEEAYQSCLAQRRVRALMQQLEASPDKETRWQIQKQFAGIERKYLPKSLKLEAWMGATMPQALGHLKKLYGSLRGYDKKYNSR